MATRLFISYSNKDEAYRDMLLRHLVVLEREGLIEPWKGRRIKAGQNFSATIDDEIKAADIILLLISPDFLQSPYWYSRELIWAVDADRKRAARVVPIILRPCDWRSAPFGRLSVLPRDGKAISKWSNLDDAFTDVVRGISRLVQSEKLKPDSESASPRAHRTPAPAKTSWRWLRDKWLGMDRVSAELVVPFDVKPKRKASSRINDKVYISYAWGDESPEGKVRAQIVDALQVALKQDGFTPIMDRDKAVAGERISAFIRQLSLADQVVVLISDKYLRSHYCMHEMYRLWQRSQVDVDQLLEFVVPVVLPEVQVASFEQRAPYLEYWAEKAQKLETLIRNPNLRPGNDSWQEVRLVREFAHHVDDILFLVNDVLMPRNLEIHLSSGFQAVREALRRRHEMIKAALVDGTRST